ncbi:MAG: VIT domain-containing protein [Chthoniobacterales bacterium]
MKHAVRLSLPTLALFCFLPLTTGLGATEEDSPRVAGVLAGVPSAAPVAGSKPPVPISLPLQKTEVHLNVSGGLIEGEVAQVFTNNTGTALEAIYVFPLPSEATVMGMELRVGDRVIRSVVKEREEARQQYETAKAQGQKTALLEQERPNIFTTSVANFNPGETVRIRFTYLQAAEYQRGKYSVTFPMVVGPRYIPFEISVPDSGRITPPLLHPAIDPGHRVTLSATVTGLPVKSITSNTHAIQVQPRNGGESYDVALREGKTLPNSEFHLEIALTGGEEPELSVVTTQAQDANFALITLFPPLGVPIDKLPPRVPRDVLFLIDTSGSMSGESIGQAQAGLLRCLDMLRPEDTFTVVRFSSDYSAFAPELRPATPDSLEAARSYVRTLRADGGTEMQTALDYTLSIPGQRENAFRLVAFLTDGDVGNEESLMRLLNTKLGSARVFTFGIGSTPNEFLMRRLAELGRGQSRFIRSHEDIGTTMSDFFRTLDQPTMTNVRLDWHAKNGQQVTGLVTYPQLCPDVFVDRPLQVVAKIPRGFDGTLEVSGKVAGGQMTKQFPLGAAIATHHDGIPTLFGQAVVNDLMYQRLRTTDATQLQSLHDQVVKTALDYQLVTAFTSRVAVEEQITRAPDGAVTSVKVPTMLPRGWNPSAFFATATSDPLRLVIGFVVLSVGALLLLIHVRRPARQ